MDYAYADFLDTLDDTGRGVLRVIHEHITGSDPAYRPCDVRPTNKAGTAWLLRYRKGAKTGKAVCALESQSGRLTVRFSCLTSMAQELLLRQNEFSAGLRKHILQQTICCVDRACRCYGGNTPCAWRQYFWINHRWVFACPYPWLAFDWLTQDDADGIRLLIDMQMKHMTQNAREIKGSGYTEENRKRCGDIRVITLAPMDLEPADTPAKLEKYARLYQLVPMGANGGLWFYRGAPAHGPAQVPGGTYAAVTVTQPMTFSLNRAWNTICEWIVNEKRAIREVCFDGQASAACFAKFSRKDGADCMQVLVPLSEETASERHKG